MSIDRPPAAWNVYFTEVRDNPASILVDLGLRAIAPLASHTCLLSVQIVMQRPAPDGLPCREESEGGLDAIEEAILAAVESGAMQAIHIGGITSDGRVCLYFYCPPDDGGRTDGTRADVAASFLRRRVDAAMAAFGSYRYRCLERHEPGWDTYVDGLCPGDGETPSPSHARSSLRVPAPDSAVDDRFARSRNRQRRSI